jgi:nucleoside-diphosphate-sugar epimerase
MEPGSAPVHGTPAAGPVGGLAGALPGCFESTTVTGGLGFIGSHLVRRLAGAGVRTTVVDSREPAAKVPGVRYVVADLRSPEQAVRALSGATLVFHLAGTLDAPGSLRDPTADFELPHVFRTGNLRLIHAASCPFRYSSMTSCGVR